MAKGRLRRPPQRVWRTIWLPGTEPGPLLVVSTRRWCLCGSETPVLLFWLTRKAISSSAGPFSMRYLSFSKLGNSGSSRAVSARSRNWPMRGGEMKVPIECLRLPEGYARCIRMCRLNDHVVVRDLLDLPFLGAEGKDLTDLRFPDKFLIEVANPGIRVGVPKCKVSPVGG